MKRETFPYRERFAILPLIPWVESTATGDIEEQNQFNPKWFQKVWDLISAESHAGDRHGCGGRHCPFFKSCFLQRARQKAQSSHVVIINHALFFSETGKADSFLGKIGSIIFDEAHHLESGGHRFLRVELDTNRVSLFMEQLNNLVQRIADTKGNESLAAHGARLKSHLKKVRKHATAFLESINAWALAKKYEAAAGAAGYQIPVTNADFSSNSEALAFANTLETIKDELYQIKQDLPASSLSASILEIAGKRCPPARSAPPSFTRTSAISSRRRPRTMPSGPKAIRTRAGRNSAAFRSTWQGCFPRYGPNATAPSCSPRRPSRSPGRLNTSSIRSVSRRIRRAPPSIFSRAHLQTDQALLGALKRAPDPDSPEFTALVASVVGDLHASFKKNILILFTANAMLDNVYKRLRADPRLARQNILAQNISGGRHALLEQFRQNQHMVLLGTDSFWEGIDVPGETCEIVVIPRLPFPVPTHPLNLAIAEKMTKLHGEAFMSYAVPGGRDPVPPGLRQAHQDFHGPRCARRS